MQNNGEQIKEAPEPSALSRQVFRNFRDATVALLDCDDTPEGAQDAVLKMLDYFNNELGGADEDVIDNAHRVMSNVFDLDDEGDEEEAQTLAPPPSAAAAPGQYKEIRAEQFTLVDDAGNEHARLRIAGGGAVLTMRDSRGRPRLRLRAGDDEATITICGERGDAGKGVLPATDEVERVTIGYESSAQEPRIVIKDGNENECVSLSIHDEDGDGVVHLKKPCGGYTGIDSAGLEVFDGDENTLAEFAARSTDAIPVGGRPRIPEAPADLDGAQFGAVDDNVIRDLVERVLPRDEDEAAKAFISIIHLIAYNDDRVSRDIIATSACDAAYQRTIAYSEVALKFFDAATAEFPLRAEQSPHDLPCAGGR